MAGVTAMNDSQSLNNDPALPLSQDAQIDRVADDFERRWRSGERPRIEECLNGVDRSARSALLHELIALEVELRRAAGESVVADEYHQRFPDDASAVEIAFGRPSQPTPASTMTALRDDSVGHHEGNGGEVEEVPKTLGRYEIRGLLGKGGFGRVYLAYDTRLGRLVAIKAPKRGRFTSTEQIDAFVHEARMAAQLKHPGLLVVHDVQEYEDGAYIVEEYIDGHNLADWAASASPSYEELVRLAIEVAEAIGFAHRHGMVHRDLKPANILIDRQGRVHVADFGLAIDENIQRRRKGEVAGTPAFMSPEQVRGETHRLDGRTDLWALGVVLYELLTGRRPFSGENQQQLFDEIERRDPRPPRMLDPEIPGELERICLKCLAKQCTLRYRSAAELVDDLRHWLDHRSPHAPREGDHHAERDAYGGQTTGAGAFSVPLGDHRGEGRRDYPPAPRRIIPKGLRSFDAADADFFLELLPGPRDRDGLPPGVRFWKAQIEQTDPDRTFSVGVMYGPSGCGKSSLVKAGLLPRLAENVVPVFIEATTADTEVRLLKALRKVASIPLPPGEGRGEGGKTARTGRVPSTESPDASLPELIAAIREGGVLSPKATARRSVPATKVLIVIDQFEQWLHARGASSDSQLIAALRQCDGAAVQCLVLVRDDFWMSVTRFMQALEIPLLEGHNSAAVDLFDPGHAKKVLAAFGRAYGKLSDEEEHPCGAGVPPASYPQAGRLHHNFLDQAVKGLTQEGKVISVRLALFAEMMKGRPWTPASLTEVGGTEGVGVAFLESTFSAKTAPPTHRLHQEAARQVLKTLLPALDTDIKGQMKSHDALLVASGYATRPAEFESLLAILDGELRLITPTEPDEGEGRAYSSPHAPREGDHHAERDVYGTANAQDPPSDNPKSKIQNPKWYQLTHDYLVPSLREWLTRKQRETYRGRAELRLAERAAGYSAKPGTRHLPGWFEWPNILLLTRPRNWTSAERRVMRAAGRHHSLRFSLLAALLFIVGLAAREAYHVAEDRRAEALARSLFAARAEGVPYALDALRPMQKFAVVHLQKEANDQHSNPMRRLHAVYGLVDLGETPPSFLLDAIATAPAAESRNIVQALEHIKISVLPDIAKLADSTTDPKAKARYAILALNLGDPAPAARALAIREDPIDRTTFIDLYPAWHGDLGAVAEELRASSNEPFRSGLCAALGVLAPQDLQTEERDALTKVFTELFLKAPDGGTHSAGSWALRTWKQPLPSVEQPAELPASRRWHVNRQGMTLILVPEGRFIMGFANTNAAINNAAAHTVSLNRSFLLCDREVTIEQFQRFVDDPDYPLSEKPDNLKGMKGPWQFEGQLPDCPVQIVNWYDAILYCNWLSKKEGKQPCYARSGPKEMVMEWTNDKQENVEYDKWACDFAKDGYRLPTEAEWEYACRAVSAKAFCCGDNVESVAAYGWLVNNSRSRDEPGGRKLPNAWGLFDMHGNVWEWCHDWYGSYDKGDGRTVDPVGPPTGAKRVFRGGCRGVEPASCQSAYRACLQPSFRMSILGFRVARSSVEPTSGLQSWRGAEK
jgi:serine/threonine protein kinase/formylglycine-generating enzyme required for sulfatase activity